MLAYVHKMISHSKALLLLHSLIMFVYFSELSHDIMYCVCRTGLQ